MAEAIDVVKDELETLFVRVNLSGLVPGTKYDVMRLRQRYLGDNDAGVPQYARELPDRAGLWSAVAHRQGWTAPAATASFRDFEVPWAPTVYFLVKSSAVGPAEWNFANGTYPISRGVLDNEVVHWNRDLHQQVDLHVIRPGMVVVRSTDELAKYAVAEVVDIDELRYVARGTEQKVIGTQYPVYVADSREARRGSIVLMVRDLGQYNDLRSIVYPASGRIRPVVFNSGGDSTLLLDDMVVVPLDVNVDQVTPWDPDKRYVTVDFVEVDPRLALAHRSGDNDVLVDPPIANFTISDTTPERGQWVTLTDTSTGQFDTWEWTIERGKETDNKIGKFYTKGPHKVRWRYRGKRTVKLRVYGSGAGAHVRQKTITVG